MTERRKRSLTDEDVEAIASAIMTHQDAHCRYNVSPDRMDAAIRFFENVNNILEDSKTTIRRTLIRILVTGIVALLLVGAGVKLWDMHIK
jgi:hypothetical protein